MKFNILSEKEYQKLLKRLGRKAQFFRMSVQGTNLSFEVTKASALGDYALPASSASWVITQLIDKLEGVSEGLLGYIK